VIPTLPEALLGDLRVDAVGQQVRRMAVPQIMKPDAGQGRGERQDPDELVGTA
jgi:hypothetical protein